MQLEQATFWMLMVAEKVFEYWFMEGGALAFMLVIFNGNRFASAVEALCEFCNL